MERKLGMAKDDKGDTVSVERVRDAPESRYSCPRCGKEVVAKLGSERVWHFAHKEGDCRPPGQPGEERFVSKGLMSYGEGTTTLDEMPVEFNPDISNCPSCKTSMHKEAMVEVKEGLFVCKGCYRSMDRKGLEELGDHR
ncbi:MAG: competence protein CoiA family protein [archaeon]